MQFLVRLALDHLMIKHSLPLGLGIFDEEVDEGLSSGRNDGLTWEYNTGGGEFGRTEGAKW